MTTPDNAPAADVVGLASDHLLRIDEPLRLTDHRGNPGLAYTGQQIIDAFKAGAALRASAPAPSEAVDELPGITELDDDAEAKVCTGCGTTKSVAWIHATSPAAFTCCPERKMIPVREAIASHEQARLQADLIGARSRLSVIASGNTIAEAYYPSTFSDPAKMFWRDVAALAAEQEER